MLTLYNVTSADGFIAREDGAEDFITDASWPDTLDIFAKYDCLMMGRKTYEAMQAYAPELLVPFEKLNIKKVVISTNHEFKPKSGYELELKPENIIAGGGNIIVSSGPTLNNYLLGKNLVDKVIIHQLTAPIEKGIEPFDGEFKKNLAQESEKQIGLVKEVIYKVSKQS